MVNWKKWFLEEDEEEVFREEEAFISQILYGQILMKKK